MEKGGGVGNGLEILLLLDVLMKWSGILKLLYLDS